MNYDLGSEWEKWDLHIHTPYTKLNDNFSTTNGSDIWKTYCDKIEASDVQVFGITDYFCIENYFTFIEKHRLYYPESKKVFFPNIELRLDVSVNKKAEEVNLHVIFSNEVTKSKLDSFLTKLNTNITIGGATVNCKELKDDQFKRAAIIYKHLIDVLKEVFGLDTCYLIMAASNNAGLRADTTSPRKLVIADEIDKICDGFFGGIQNIEYYLRIDRYETSELSVPKPVVSGSDCHSFDDVDNFLGKRFERSNPQTGQVIIEKDITWIKAERSFEGLRQIFHEPLFRKEISDITPRRPLRKIDKIKFNFPNSAKIKNKNSSEYQDLCIKNLKNEIYLSPHFTCFIGGRGTGKSTIINTIAEKLGIKTEFFDPNNNGLFMDENVKCDLREVHKDLVEIEGTNDIEFVSQGRVEKLTEGQALTRLIFDERILQPNNNLQDLKTQVELCLKTIDEQIRLIFDLKKIRSEIKEKRREKQTHEGIVNSIADPLYSEITGQIKTLSKSISELNNSELRYQDVIKKLRLLIEEIQTEEFHSNSFEKRIREIKSHLLLLNEFSIIEDELVTTELSFEDAQSLRDELKYQLQDVQENLKHFFEGKGTSEESIQDSQNANESLARAVANIKALNDKAVNSQTKLISNYEIVKNIKNIKLGSEAIIRAKVDELSSKLDRKNENVSSISYVYKFNRKECLTAFFEDFRKTFTEYHILNTSWEDIKSLIFEIEPNENLLSMSYCKFLAELNSIIESKRYDRSRNYVSVVTNIFCEILNYRVYQYLIFRHFLTFLNTFKSKASTGEES